MRSFRISPAHGRLPKASVCAFATALICIGVIVAGCSKGAPTATGSQRAVAAGAPPPSLRLVPTATIRELMDDMIDPSADAVWGSVGIVRTQSETFHREPRTSDQWTAVRAQAMTLAESANLLIIGPRQAAPKGTIAGEGELSPAEIDKRIAANPAAFEELAVNLREVARKGLSAIERRNAGELFDVGGEIDVACEACHITFWYPEQAPRKTAK